MLVIGLDVGTTGTKAVVADENGTILAGGYREYELITREGGIVAQNAEDWWDAVVSSVRKATADIDKSDIRAIGISTQGASMLAAGNNGEALSEVITWMDNRATKETAVLDAKLGTDVIYKKCGWRLTPAGDAAKIMWLRDNMPESFNAASCFVSTLEYVNKKLCGRYVIDPTNAAIRQLFNISSGKWDSEVLDAVGITSDRLPEVMPIGARVGNLTAEAAEALGLSEEVTVYNGAHDQYCAALGCGATKAGDMLLATGTTWVVLGVTDGLLYTDSYIAPGIHPAKGTYGAMASLVSAGSSMKWYKNLIDGDFRTMDDEAEKRASSAAELYFLPYLAGAGFPHNRPELHGGIFGLEMRHDKYDIARALMEGVAFEARQVLESFKENGMTIETLMMTGGAARSRLWSEIVGYVTGCDIYRMTEPETCSVGAAMLAFVGEGVFADYDDAGAAMVKSEKLALPDTEMFGFYEKKYAEYKKLQERIMSL